MRKCTLVTIVNVAEGRKTISRREGGFAISGLSIMGVALLTRASP